MRFVLLYRVFWEEITEHMLTGWNDLCREGKHETKIYSIHSCSRNSSAATIGGWPTCSLLRSSYVRLYLDEICAQWITYICTLKKICVMTRGLRSVLYLTSIEVTDRSCITCGMHSGHSSSFYYLMWCSTTTMMVWSIIG